MNTPFISLLTKNFNFKNVCKGDLFIILPVIPLVFQQIFIHENSTVHTGVIVFHDIVKVVSYFQRFLKLSAVSHYSFP